MFRFFGIFLGIYIWVNFVTSFLSLAIDIIAKWVLIGRRVPGEYHFTTKTKQNSLFVIWFDETKIWLESKLILPKVAALPYSTAHHPCWLFWQWHIGMDVRFCLYPDLISSPPLIPFTIHHSILPHVPSSFHYDSHRSCLVFPFVGMQNRRQRVPLSYWR